MRIYLLLCIIILHISVACKKGKKTGDNTVIAIEMMDSSYPCLYDNLTSSLGIGLIIPPTKFEIFRDSLIQNKLISCNMDSVVYLSKINICSKYYKPDYGIMHFVCLKENKVSYEILVNHSTIRYLPKSKQYTFLTWNDYILQSYGIRRLTDENGDISAELPLRKQPNNNSDTISIPKGLEMFCPLEIRGDWVKVQYDCFYNNENNPYEGEPCHNFINKCKAPLTGWLKWRNNNHVLIDIFLMP